MKLPNDIRIFEGKDALLVATGKQVAQLYRAKRHTVTPLAEVKVETPTYSDREGHFARRGQGKTMGSGSVYENKDEKIITEFVHALHDTVKQAAGKNQFSDMWLFVPEFMVNVVMEHMPSNVQTIIRDVIPGNFTKDEPLTLAKHIAEVYETKRKEHEEERVPEEAEKLLRRGR